MPIRDTRAERLQNRDRMITEFEGYEPNAYRDSEGIPTIGIGATSYEDGSPVRMGESIDRGRADELLRFHIDRARENLVNEPGYQGLDPNARVAVDSFAYNAGPNFINDDEGFGTINRAIRSSDAQGVADALPLYDNSGTPGLVRRRAAEAELATTPAMDPVDSTLANDRTRAFGTEAVLNGEPVNWGGTNYGWQSPESFATIEPPAPAMNADTGVRKAGGIFGMF